VASGDSEVEVEFDFGRQKRLWLHSTCFWTWDRVRRQFADVVRGESCG